MSISAPFIHRPVATTLLTVALGLSGVIAYNFLPVAPLPQVDYPALQVFAGLPGASPETMASSVATPLERQFGRIAGLNEMTSSSTLGPTNITLQFDLDRDINAAARDVQAGINAARNQLPANLPQNPTWRKNNPSDPPILNLVLTSATMTPGQMYDVATTILQQKVSQMKGVGRVTVGGSSLPGVRVEVNPTLLNDFGLGLEDVRAMLGNANTNRPKGEISNDTPDLDAGNNRSTDEGARLPGSRCRVPERRGGKALRHRRSRRFGRRPPQRRLRGRAAGHHREYQPPAGRQYHRNGGPHSRRAAPVAGPAFPPLSTSRRPRTGP